MDSKPFISIIIPTLNSEISLQKCLDSIINQNFSNYEILIIDGVSIDNTLKIAKGYNDERIKIYSEPDKGIYDAMNKGIKIALGKWIYFLGSDDVLFINTTLSLVYSYLSGTKWDVIYGDVISTRFNGIYGGEFDYIKLRCNNICHQAIFFNHKLFKKIGNFNLKYHRYADYDHNIRWFLNKKISRIYVDQVITKYADGGYSSLGIDSVFLDERNYKIVRAGIETLPKHYIKELCKEGCKKNFKNLYLKILLIKLIILDKMHTCLRNKNILING